MVALSFRSAPAQNMPDVALQMSTARTLGSKRILSSAALNWWDQSGRHREEKPSVTISSSISSYGWTSKALTCASRALLKEFRAAGRFIASFTIEGASVPTAIRSTRRGSLLALLERDCIDGFLDCQLRKQSCVTEGDSPY